MPKFTTTTLLYAVTAASCCFALVQFDFRVGASIFVAGVTVAGFLTRDPRIARFTIYGAVGGAIIVVTAFLVAASLRSEWPFVRSYTAPHTCMNLARQFAIPFGGGLGAVAGILLSQRPKLKPKQDDSLPTDQLNA